MGFAFRLFKTTFALLFGLVFFALIGGLIYLNQVGFPGHSGEWLRGHLAEKGVHLSFDSLRLDLRRGLIAKEVAFFADEEKSIPLLTAHEMIVDLDKMRALRGEFLFRKIEVSDGSATIPVGEEKRMVAAHGINGSLSLSESGRAEINHLTGLIEGIKVTLSANLKQPPPSDEPADPAVSDQTARILSMILDELALWELPDDAPPEVDFHISGDLADAERINTRFHLRATGLKRNDYELSKLKLSGDFKSQIVTVDEILLDDVTGRATGKADWSVVRREGRFHLDSSLRIKRFLKTCFGVEILKEASLSISPVMQARGTFSAPQDQPFSVHATGHARIGKFTFLGTDYEQLDSDFSWKDGDLFLRDLTVIHRKGQLDGSILAQQDLVRFDVRSTLGLAAFRPFIKADSPLEKGLAEAEFMENSIVALDVVGSLKRDELTKWEATGKFHLSNFSYRGTAIHHLAADYEIIPGQAQFAKISMLLNDEKEKARLRHAGPASEEIFADRVLYDSKSRVTTISNLRGRIWPTPVIRVFAKSVAKHVEKNYRFHEPPQVTLNGAFAGRKGDFENTRFSVELLTDGQTDYPFLGEDLPLRDLAADIQVRGPMITVKNLGFRTLGGSASGTVFADVTPGKKARYGGSIKWDKLSFPLISKTYKFEKEEQGSLTGNIDFNGQAGGVKNFNADGVIGISQGNLVSLPVLGPLSPIVAGVLGSKKLGYEKAKDASATYAIRAGVMQTADFVATSRSITLTGEGWVDLSNKKMDMTVRVNARGLLGLLTLPLQPLKGIFQFRGTGTYSEPKWKNSPFTKPAKGEADPLFQKAGKAQPVAE